MSTDSRTVVIGPLEVYDRNANIHRRLWNCRALGGFGLRFVVRVVRVIVRIL